MNRHKYNVYMCVCPYCVLRLFSFTDHDVWENCESDDIKTMYKSAFAYHRYMGETTSAKDAEGDWIGEIFKK